MTRVAQASTAVPDPKSATNKMLKAGGASSPAFKHREQFWWPQDGSIPAPSIENLVPTNTPAGGSDITLFVHGSNFISESKIWISGVEEPTHMLSDTVLYTGVRPGLVAPGTAVVQVKTGTAVSNEVIFTFT